MKVVFSFHNEPLNTNELGLSSDGRVLELKHYVHVAPSYADQASGVVIEDIVTGGGLSPSMVVATYRYPLRGPRARASVEHYKQDGRPMWKVRVEATSFKDAKKLFDLIMYGGAERYVYQTFVGNTWDAGLRLGPSTLRQIRELLNQIDNPTRAFNYIQDDLEQLRALLDPNL